MSSQRRLSMNTSLKDARIFEDICDDALDFDFSQNEKKYSVLSSLNENPNSSANEKSDIELDLKLSMIKQEIIADIKIKTEPPERPSTPVENLISSEGQSNHNQGDIKDCWSLKREIVEEDSLQEVKKELSASKRIKIEMLDDNTNEDTSNHSFKSVKKSVFTRLSPYLKPRSEFSPVAEKVNKCVKNLSIDKTRQSKVKEYESDPDVLSRRQKQIDFGKNTIGYDNYIRTVPRYSRARNEPRTPDKYRKYSRRGWDSLIKHWRLQLHNYD